MPWTMKIHHRQVEFEAVKENRIYVGTFVLQRDKFVLIRYEFAMDYLMMALWCTHCRKMSDIATHTISCIGVHNFIIIYDYTKKSMLP